MNNFSDTAAQVSAVDSRFMLRVFYVFAALAFLSVAISVGGKWLGATIAMAGHTTSREIHEIVIGNNVLLVPSNEIRFERARQSGDTSRLDLYFLWPSLEGYSNAERDAFNNRQDRKLVIFASIEEAMMSRDMSGRFEPIYSNLISLPARSIEDGLKTYDFRSESGYTNEILVVGERPGQPEFVARCLDGDAAAQALASCERDVRLGDGLTVTYRFSERHLWNWKEIDAAVLNKIRAYVQGSS